MIHPPYPYAPPIAETSKHNPKWFDPVEAGTKTAHVVFILDDSGSMGVVREATISGFNEFLVGQKRAEIPTYVSLYTFDGGTVKSVYSHIPASDAPDLNYETYQARGHSTNLLDAIGDVLQNVNVQLKAKKLVGERDSVTVVILTDGQENSSRKFDREAIAHMVRASEEMTWSFFFLGANIDAFGTGHTLGFSTANTMQYKTSNIVETMQYASRAANTMKGARAMGLNSSQAYAASEFTAEERTEADK